MRSLSGGLLSGVVNRACAAAVRFGAKTANNGIEAVVDNCPPTRVSNAPGLIHVVRVACVHSAPRVHGVCTENPKARFRFQFGPI